MHITKVAFGEHSLGGQVERAGKFYSEGLSPRELTEELVFGRSSLQRSSLFLSQQSLTPLLVGGSQSSEWAVDISWY